MIFLLFLALEANAMVFKKLPSAVEIGKQTYPIVYQKQIDRGKLAGVCYYGGHSKIKVSMDQEKEEIESTVFHEILHAIAHEYGVPLTEKEVLKLEQGIYETFEKNKWQIFEK